MGATRILDDRVNTLFLFGVLGSCSLFQVLGFKFTSIKLTINVSRIFVCVHMTLLFYLNVFCLPTAYYKINKY